MVSTKEVYQSLKADELSSHPDIDGMIEALKQGSEKELYEAVCSGNLLFSDLFPYKGTQNG